MRRPAVVIIGRTNVGKSTLFNRLLRHRAAVVDDREAVTRDRHYRLWDWEGRTLDLVDTGGLVGDEVDPLAEHVLRQIILAIEDAAVVLFLIDARTGLVYQDLEMAKLVRRTGRPVLLLANKAERPEDRHEMAEWEKLGLGPPMCTSATTGYGMEGLFERLRRLIPVGTGQGRVDSDPVALRLAILGRPNVGKSTLVNRLLGEERLIVSPLPGTTRDSIDTECQWEGRRIVLTDTAGLRKKARVDDDVEYYSNLRSLESIRRSDVVALMVEADGGVEEQDLRILRMVEEAGRGMVMVLSKWDAVEKDHRTFDQIVREVCQRVPLLEHVPFVALSGLTGQRAVRLIETSLRVRDDMRRVLGRDAVVEWFRQTVSRRPPPTAKGHAIRLDRCCQVHVDPPILAVETKYPEVVPETYRRYLRARAVEDFDLRGVPLRVAFRDRLELRTDDDLARFSA